jgi:hypothetical protein
LDIAVAVHNLENVEGFIEPLKQIGYEFIHHKEFQKGVFLEKDNGEQEHIIYIFMRLKVKVGKISSFLEII